MIRNPQEPLIEASEQNDFVDAPVDPVRQERLNVVRLEVSSKLARGESVSLARVLAENPDLMPELAEELRLIELTHRQLLAAQRADAPVRKPSVHEPEDHPFLVQGYRLIKELDAGGQGIVFHAEQLS